MRRFVASVLALITVIAANAQINTLDRTLSVKDTAAWNALENRLNEIRKERPTVALVLGGGGAKGTSHIGVLKYLEEIDMPVDVVLGTSMGGLVGGFFSLGYAASQIEAAVSAIPWNEMMSDSVPEEYISYDNRRYKEKFPLNIPFSFKNGKFLKTIPSAYIEGQNVANLISSFTVGYQDPMQFVDLPIPFVCVATDLIEGVGHVWLSGELNDALRTTMSIPLVFAPVRKDGMYLVDGGMRNNFPADIAKALGADIIIGVSVGTPSVSYDEASGLADVISLVIDLSGKASLSKTYPIPDIRLTPELDGVSSLSFSDENIQKMIENGYAEAKRNAGTLKALKARVQKHSLRRNGPRAKALTWDKVQIEDIHFKGLGKDEEELFKKDIQFVPGQPIGKEDLDYTVGKMYGTNAFRTINYEISGKEGSYSLELDCQKGHANRFGLGGRFDTEEMVNAYVNITRNANTFHGYSLALDLKLSANPYAKLSFKHDFINAPTLGISADIQFANTSLMSYVNSPFNLTYLSTTQQLTMSNMKFSLFDVEMGLSNKLVKIIENNTDNQYNRHNSDRYMASGDRWQNATDYLGIFLHGAYDKLKGGNFFPVSGQSLYIDYTWQFLANPAEKLYFQDINYHTLSFGIKGAVTRGIFTYLPSFDMRLIASFNHDYIPMHAFNMIGGAFSGRYFPQQLKFCGLTGVHSVKDNLFLFRNDFRFNVADKQYLTAKIHMALFTDNFANGFDFTSARNFLDNSMDLGVGIEYSYDTLIGPFAFEIGWTTIKMADPKYHGIDITCGVGYFF